MWRHASSLGNRIWLAARAFCILAGSLGVFGLRLITREACKPDVLCVANDLSQLFTTAPFSFSFPSSPPLVFLSLASCPSPIPSCPLSSLSLSSFPPPPNFPPLPAFTPPSFLPVLLPPLLLALTCLLLSMFFN